MHRGLLTILALLVGGLSIAAADALATPAGLVAQSDAMSLWQAALLGLVEGITEFLPVSSTGHLLVVQQAMGIGTESAEAKDAADAFAICIQFGAILAIFGLYLNRVKQMVRGLRGKDPAGRRLVLNLLVAFIPAAVIGLLFHREIKHQLFGLWPVVAAWAVGGAAILIVARSKKEETKEGRAGLALEGLVWRTALVIGLAQCVAMWPGVSRSLATIVGGVLVGLSLSAAVEFSFLLGLVTLSAAMSFDVLQHGSLLAETYTPGALITGTVFAFISAGLAVRWMVAYLHKHGLAVFGYYRLAIALLVAIWLG